VILILFPVFSLIIGLRFGSAEINTGDFFSALMRRSGYETLSAIIYYSRLPRVLGAFIAGIGLSICGLLLQTSTGNSLASPNIIGINSGAGLFVLILTALFPAAYYFIPIAAFFGALSASVLILIFSRFIGGSRHSLILAGIALTTLFNSAISFLSLLYPDALVQYSHFSVGGLSGLSLKRLYIPAVFVAFSLIVTVFFSRRIGILRLGDDIAVSLGINVKRLRIIITVCAAASAAAAVSVAGLIGFVGLVVPHIACRLSGNDSFALQIYCTAAAGPSLLILSDLLGRVIFAPTELPAGIMTAVIGAPFFIWLLIAGRNRTY